MRLLRAVDPRDSPEPAWYAVGPGPLSSALAARLPDADGRDASSLFAAAGPWSESLGRAEQVLASAGTAASELRLRAPVQRPGKIIAIGLNYADHTAESGLPAPAEPLTFAKYPTSVIGPDESIVVPSAITVDVDWEAELAVVIGTTCGPASRGTLEHVAGYTVANDVSARDLQFRDQQWTRAKSIDTFCPLGPVLVSAEEFGDPAGKRIWTTVNGQTMQDASTADMIFDVPALLDYLTATVTLEPGDVVLTGTPPGVGGFRTPPVFLADGDVVTVGVDGIGELSNPVRHV